jgi:hypothetical protein
VPSFVVSNRGLAYQPLYDLRLIRRDRQCKEFVTPTRDAHLHDKHLDPRVPHVCGVKMGIMEQSVERRIDFIRGCNGRPRLVGQVLYKRQQLNNYYL